MKRACLTLVLVCMAFVSQAQRKKQEFILSSRGLLDVQAGIGIPVLDYGLSKLTLPAGYAQSGVVYRIGASYDLAPFLGLTFQYQYNKNPYNTSKLLTDLQAQGGDVIYNSFRANPWELSSTMLGLYYPFKSYRSSIDIRALGGLCSGTYPENEANITFRQAPNDPYNFKEFETGATGFGFQLGVKMRYLLYKNLMLVMAADYTQTKLEFTEIHGIETYRNLGYSVQPYTQKFQLVNLSVGIGMQFE